MHSLNDSSEKTSCSYGARDRISSGFNEPLSADFRFHRSAVDLRFIRCVVQPQSNQRSQPTRHRQSDRRQTEIEKEQLNQDWRATKELDIDRTQPLNKSRTFPLTNRQRHSQNQSDS